MGVGFAGRKSKGSKAENELLNKFWQNGWGGIRCAGSGSSRNPTPDILVGNGERILAMEVKITKDRKKYFTNEEIESLMKFAGTFGAHPMVGVQFENNHWYFMSVDDLRSTEKSYVASMERAQSRGLSFEELLRI